MKGLIAFAVLAVLLFGCVGSPINQGVTADGMPYRGAANPKLVIYEYSDFQCPYCLQVQPTVEEVLRSYPDSVQLQFKNNPLEQHPRAFAAAIAGVCAAEQGKFWEMHDQLFAHQAASSDEDFAKFAGAVGINADKFRQCYASPEAAQKVRADMAQAKSLGLDATPMFVIGDSLVRGAQSTQKFRQAIDAELAAAN